MKKIGILALVVLVLAGCGTKPAEEIEPVQDTPKTDLSQIEPEDSGHKLTVISVGGRTFEVEIADTVAKRQMGLMNRTEMPEGKGMLFVFEEPGMYRFWMKDTLIPLDIIWLDENYKVITQVTAPPCEADPCPKFGPEAPASFVLEVAGGSF